ncbi:uncharacterized protein B0H64DRAFT_441789 [Chaetomium fimeti]|uniref:Uncharacterized protein n=1 Tax=Chaetomium fimeti TaxID=1854472 RepID=A0AAE0HGR8_9PEZI|nr:hypothetical protein B0H64DRAFT_441789 [Chaetomium fimeti]
MCKGVLTRYYCMLSALGHSTCPYYDEDKQVHRFWRTAWRGDLWVCCLTHPGPCKLCPNLLNPGNIRYHNRAHELCPYCREDAFPLSPEELAATRARLAQVAATAMPVSGVADHQGQEEPEEMEEAQGSQTTLNFENLRLE